QKVFPRIKISPDHRTELGNGWTQIFVATSELDPEGVPFDRIVLRAFRNIGSEWVLFDKIGLIKGSGGAGARSVASYDVATLPQGTMAIDCAAKWEKKRPYIYGLAYSPFEEKKQDAQGLGGPPVGGWGATPASVYNWELDAWNRGNVCYNDTAPA